LPIAACVGVKIATIEHLHHPVQEAWIEHQVPQCGYCQSGQIMAAAALLGQNPRPTDADIDAGITNLCRCATYHRIRKAIHATAAKLPPPPPPPAPPVEAAAPADAATPPPAGGK
jgi:isoquinoline 1-oxidoreductase alpha subunit